MLPQIMLPGFGLFRFEANHKSPVLLKQKNLSSNLHWHHVFIGQQPSLFVNAGLTHSPLPAYTKMLMLPVFSCGHWPANGRLHFCHMLCRLDGITLTAKHPPKACVYGVVAACEAQSHHHPARLNARVPPQ